MCSLLGRAATRTGADPRSDWRRFSDALLWLAWRGAARPDRAVWALSDGQGALLLLERNRVFDRLFAAVAADPDLE